MMKEINKNICKKEIRGKRFNKKQEICELFKKVDKGKIGLRKS